jgi:hypothetical protein
VTVVSDSHLSGRAPELQRNWRAVLRHVQRTAPDLVIHLGDLSVDGAHDPGDLHYARTELDRLAVPWLAVPGSHDVGGNPGTADSKHGAANTSRPKRWLDAVGADRWATPGFYPGLRQVALCPVSLRCGNAVRPAGVVPVACGGFPLESGRCVH